MLKVQVAMCDLDFFDFLLIDFTQGAGIVIMITAAAWLPKDKAVLVRTESAGFEGFLQRGTGAVAGEENWMSAENRILSVGGYLFYTEKDAQLARAEEQKIDYLEARIDYSSPESIRYIYEHTIQERLFRTPVGLRYLEKLRNFLLEQPGADPAGIMDIPLYMTFDGEVREHANPARERVTPSKKKDREKSRFFISVIANVLMAAAILSMFYISYISDQPNIVNYERELTSKYASWEQELTRREQVIREKERELQINP